MTKVHFTSARTKRKTDRPAKPHVDYPLTYHPSGRWCKKIKGELHYFGKAIADNGASAQAALELWLEQKDALLAGRVPRPKGDNADGPTLRELVNKFLTAKKEKQDCGELSPFSFLAYHKLSEKVIAHFGIDRLLSDIRQEDFQSLRAKWAMTKGPALLGSEINRTKAIFNFAYRTELIEKPIKFGEGFKKPSLKAMRLHRAERGENMFEADELRRIIEAAEQPLKAMILVGANCAFGNSDVGTMPMKSLDLKGGWINFHRGKTGIARRCPLWKETQTALREWLAMRPTPVAEANADLVFLTPRGGSWIPNLTHRPLTLQTKKLLDSLGIGGRRSFYSLRHTFETIAGDSLDQVATGAIMGHVDSSMSANYRERISDARLQAVAEHVRTWLFGTPGPEGGVV